MEETKVRVGLLFQLARGTRQERRGIARSNDTDWLGEAVLQMRDVLEEDGFVVEGDVIEQHEVLVDLAHVADVRDHRNTEFFLQGG
jgi:hypothetical protein